MVAVMFYVVLVKSDYVPASAAYRKDDNIIFSKYAKWVHCKHGDKWKIHNKLTVVKEKREIPCWYETHNGRVATYALQ